MGAVDDTVWEVRIEGETAVLELPRRLALDEQGGDRLRQALSAAVERPAVDRVLTLLRVEHPLSAALHDAICTGARTAAANGVTEWYIVADHAAKAAALERELAEVDTAVFPDEGAARRTLA